MKKGVIIAGGIVIIFAIAWVVPVAMPSVASDVSVSDATANEIIQVARTHFDNPIERLLVRRYQIAGVGEWQGKPVYTVVGRTFFGIAFNSAQAYESGGFITIPRLENDFISGDVPDDAMLVNGTAQAPTDETLSAPDQAGKRLSNNKCTGTEQPQLTHLPMDIDDFSMIIPYGLMIGAHVTPIDHQYFEPADRSLGLDAYPVYAMADAHIVDIGIRPRTSQTGESFSDYRLVFSMSCHLFYYYDLVTSLTPELQAAFDQQGSEIDYPIRAGEQIGYIGEQTLDFAVWDTERPLTGYIVPEHYEGEMWKIYTADPLEYYTDELRDQALSKYIRTTEPRSGKIDYDIDGQLIGNWFQQKADGTTDGYAGGAIPQYWFTHLSFSPDHIDPSGFVISIGNWPDQNQNQFAALGNAPDPATVGVETGFVKYDLTQINYRTGSGYWDRVSYAPPITFESGTHTYGCALVQLTDDRTLRFESFSDVSCASVDGFTDAALNYIR